MTTRLKNRILNFLYNLDRALASLLGAPAQETLSSEIGRHRTAGPIERAACSFLDHIQAQHCELAVKHAEALDKVDDGFVG